jgi:quercetin dioxygenase-like cupin family protein
MTSSSPSSSNSSRNKKGQKKFWLLGDIFTFHATGAETDGQYAVVEVSSPPGGGPPLHSHTNETEGIYVIDGEFSIQHGDDNIVTKPGAFLHLKKKIPHAYKNIGNSTGLLLLQYIPAGFENFFAEVGILIDNEETFSAPSNDTIDITKIVRIAYENYGLNIMMPKAYGMQYALD